MQGLYKLEGVDSVHIRHAFTAVWHKSNYLQISKHDGIDTCQVVYVPSQSMIVETNKYTMLSMQELYKLEGQDSVSVMRL